MNIFKIIFFLSLVVGISTYTYADKPAVVKYIESNSKVTIIQNNKIDDLINRYILTLKFYSSEPYMGVGFRVQVFSSNNQQTAKFEAINYENKIRMAFPEESVYRTYSSPFWKVRVGNFRSREEADIFRKKLLKELPAMSSESYVVSEKNIIIK